LTLQDEIAQRVSPFSEFSTKMTALPSVNKMDTRQRDILLHDLYSLACSKALKDRWAEHQRHAIPLLREQGREISKVVTLFRNKAQALENTREAFGGSIFEVEVALLGEVFRSVEELAVDVADKNKNCVAGRTVRSLVGTRANRILCKRLPVPAAGGQLTVTELIAKLLRAFAGHAIQIQQTIATNIPPTRRTKREKQLARQYFADIRADREPHPWPPVGANTRAIHHWLIGEASCCLDKFCPKLKIRGKLIARMFEAAFDDFTISEESVKKELRRQREQGRPMYRLYTWNKMLSRHDSSPLV
jgi:hypothetical protein